VGGVLLVVGPVGLEPTTRGFPQQPTRYHSLVLNILADLGICMSVSLVVHQRFSLIPVQNHGVFRGSASRHGLGDQDAPVFQPLRPGQRRWNIEVSP